MESPVAMGLDLSLTRSGVAFVGGPLDGGIETYSFGRAGKRGDSLLQRHARLLALQNEIVGTLAENIEWPLVAVIEDVPFGTPGGSVTDRAGLWWMVVNELVRQEIPVVAVNVSKVKIYAVGRANKVEKDEIMLTTARRYPEAPIKNNDEADAVNLAMIGARLVGRPYEDRIPQDRLRAMDGLEMPQK